MFLINVEVFDVVHDVFNTQIYTEIIISTILIVEMITSACPCELENRKILIIVK